MYDPPAPSDLPYRLRKARFFMNVTLSPARVVYRPAALPNNPSCFAIRRADAYRSPAVRDGLRNGASVSIHDGCVNRPIISSSTDANLDLARARWARERTTIPPLDCMTMSFHDRASSSFFAALPHMQSSSKSQSMVCGSSPTRSSTRRNIGTLVFT
jgi:hypothetical protein